MSTQGLQCAQAQECSQPLCDSLESTDNYCEVTKVQPCHSNGGFLRRLSLSLVLLLIAALPAVFAGGSSKGEPQTFGAYQIDLDSGPVGITIKGHSATQVVTISEENIPSDIDIHYTESGGILHVKATYTGETKATDSSKPVGNLVATMPRYEFVHIVTTSGDVSIDNLSTDHLTIQTAAGSIKVVNTNAALKAKSTTGDQSYTQIYGSIDAASTDGNLAVDHTWGTMKLASKSGSLLGKSVAVAGNSSYNTTSGSIEMGLVYGLGRYTFDIRSKSGQLKLGNIDQTGEIRWGRGNIRITSVSETGAQNFQ